MVSGTTADARMIRFISVAPELPSSVATVADTALVAGCLFLATTPAPQPCLRVDDRVELGQGRFLSPSGARSRSKGRELVGGLR